jgi:hypothetical protein
MSNQLLQTFILVCSTVLLRAQAPGSLKDSCFLSSPAFFVKTAAKADRLNERLSSQTEKIMRNFKKREGRIQKKLQKIDPDEAKELFLNAKQEYKNLEERLTGRLSIKHYIPILDTLLTTLKFFNSTSESTTGIDNEQILAKLNALQSKFEKGDEVRSFLDERRQFLEDRISRFGLAKDIKKISRQVYYFGEKLNECRVVLDDPGTAARKVIEIVSKSKVFRDFFRKNSLLASLFPMPEYMVDSFQEGNLVGLQTRTQVNNILEQQLPDANARSLFQHNLQEAQTRLDKWKLKILESRKNNSTDLMPGNFKTNNQKTKTFLQRIEFGLNVQTQKTQDLLLMTSELGLSLGYKLNDRSTIGIGSSYKLGLGRNWSHLQFSRQGIGLRTFIDWELKGSLWLAGGYELNHQASLEIPPRLKHIANWQQSGLIGISKFIPGRNKILKKTKLQLLWDFLSYHRRLRSQPLLMRVAYNLN